MRTLLSTTITLFLVTLNSAYATPSSTYWTAISPDIQSYLIPHLGIDNYFEIDRSKEAGSVNDLPTDLGLTIGVLPFQKLQMEIGVDANYPGNFPYSFNAKVGAVENALSSWSPALQVGIFGVGTKSDVTNANVVYGVVGKTLPYIGRVTAGPYVGNKKVLVNSNGEKKNTGFMIAIDHGFNAVKDLEGNEYNKYLLVADYASGKNSIGGGGFGLSYFFTKNVSLLSGPVWFNETTLNGKWKWTTQLDINL